MTELELRRKAVAKFKEWLGYSEADGRYRQIVDIYNAIRPLPVGYTLKYSDAWCAATVSAVGQALGMTDVILPECSCPRMIDLYSERGQWIEDDAYVPQIGDIIMYDWQDTGAGDNRGNADHVGMVAAVNGTSLTIIEGNNGDAVAYRTLQVNGRYIRGYCLPDYASKATEGSGSVSNEAGAWSQEARDWAVSIGLFQGAGTLPDGTPDYQWKRQPTREELAELFRRFAVHIGKV